MNRFEQFTPEELDLLDDALTELQVKFKEYYDSQIEEIGIAETIQDEVRMERYSRIVNNGKDNE